MSPARRRAAGGGGGRDVAAQVAELRRTVAHHSRRYHVFDDPEIGDEEYDELFARLAQLESEHPELVTPDSPTQRVGEAPVEHLEKVAHEQPMLSLANARSEEQLRAWVERMRNHLAREGIQDPPFSYVCEPKIDGLAISLLYRDGVLVRGATRGDGLVGEDVTHNLRTMPQVPLRIEDAPPLIEVRGEVYMSLRDFAELNERRAADGRSTFMNPRNSAAGTIRQLDPKLAADRPLSLWAYGIGALEGMSFGRHSEALDWLREHGFPVNGEIVQLESEDELVAQCRSWEQRRNALNFEIDGVVVKVDQSELQRRLGVVGRDPRWAIAWKFAPTTKVTTLSSVEWNVGKFGDLHPYAVLEPVVVGGVTVKLATLHNEEDLRRKDIRPGDEVIVLRAGDVIPQVLSPAPHAVENPERSAPPEPPARCPSCDTETVKPEGYVFTKCPNRRCPGRQWQLMKSFVGRAAMDIDGIGERQVAQLQEQGLVSSPADFYRLSAEQLEPLDGFGEISARNAIAAIDASRARPFERVLYALGIEEVGTITARSLAQRFRSIDALLAASVEEIAETFGIGTVVGRVIHDQLADPQMRALIDELRGVGLRFEEEGGPVEGPLSGRTIVLTGTLEGLTREEASELIRAAGGRVATNVSRKTDYVVAGASPGAKLAKAERIGVTVLDEGGLRKLLAGEQPEPAEAAQEP